MNILITGAAGFLGRHFAKALDGHDVAELDTQWSPADDVRRVFARDETRFDLVIHAAAHVGGRKDIEGRPTFLGAYNLQLDGALFEWALRTRPGRIVYLSSSAVYPLELQEDAWIKRLTDERAAWLIEEDQDIAYPRMPDATYGWVKLTGERLAAEAQTEGLKVIVVRPFSGYGEDQDEAYPFPAFAARARRRDDPFRIWGDGTQVRDWIHVDDVVAGTLAAVEQDVQGPVNLCTGRAVSFNELAALFAAEAGYTPTLEHVLDAPRGVSYRVGDPTKMLTFFEPKVELEEGIRRALA